MGNIKGRIYEDKIEDDKLKQANNNIKELIEKMVEYEEIRLCNMCPNASNRVRKFYECPKNKNDKITCSRCQNDYLQQFKKELTEFYIVE